ncbi:type II toxin-antitoxin system VapC family toxin [Lacihabitans sp. LS3-19]|uniref:type II toxin-antitoxin system VapC family toxin n=1 Tax=Lacihabitans sp. LS3-19 TaxID=2487335 RepID=UPI0028858BEB|nr:type II toxin-antitoxin system VapC family toxin [Lacihabitans sp. LS3-19]
MVLLDTSILIEYFRKTNKENSVFFQLTEKHDAFAISSLTKYEIEVGINDQNKFFWEELLSNLTVFNFDSETAKICSENFKKLKSQNLIIEFIDLAIACTALQNNLEIATLNYKHFERVENLKILKFNFN